MSALLLPRSAQRGLTLVEMLVGLVIGLVIALAAATAYVGSRGAASATENLSKVNETGKLALDYIGREIQMAGFYPANLPVVDTASGATLTNVIGRYYNIVSGAPAPYNQGLFGCDGANFNPSTNTCPSAVTNAPDSIVINYFTSDVEGTGTFGLAGHTNDCNRNNPGNFAANAGRTTTVPPLPLLISNRFGLVATNYNGPNGAISTRSIACSGNGSGASPVYQPAFEGVEDLVLRYGVNDGMNSQSPTQFYTAAQVNAMPQVGGLNGWQRVSAVQVCIVVRTLSNARLNETGSTTQSYANCRGGTTSYSASDRTIYKRFIQTFAARNNLNGST